MVDNKSKNGVELEKEKLKNNYTVDALFVVLFIIL